MNKSDSISSLAKALSLLQGELRDPVKDNTAYNFKYADLPTLLAIVRPLLAKYGLSVTQLPEYSHEKVIVTGLLMHESGEWLSSTIEMFAEKGKQMNVSQSIGSTITYCRRYQLAAMIVAAQTDTDANLQGGAEPIVAPKVIVRLDPMEILKTRMKSPNVKVYVEKVLEKKAMRLDQLNDEQISKLLDAIDKPKE